MTRVDFFLSTDYSNTCLLLLILVSLVTRHSCGEVVEQQELCFSKKSIATLTNNSQYSNCNTTITINIGSSNSIYTVNMKKKNQFFFILLILLKVWKYTFVQTLFVSSNIIFSYVHITENDLGISYSL